jgi:hypothetical protein
MEIDLSLFDINLDDIEDVPGVGAPPSGVYELLITVEPKQVTSKKDGAVYNLIEFRCKILSVIEQRNENAEPVLPGHMFSVSTSVEPDRLRWHKENLLALMQIAEVNKMSELFKVPYVRVIAKVKRVVSEDGEKSYANLSNIQAA